MTAPTLKTLSNGMKIVVSKVSGAQSARISLYVNGGSSSEPRHAHGLAHFVEHLTFCGASTIGNLNRADRLSSLGYQSNAYTDEEGISYALLGLGSKWRDALEELLHMASDFNFSERQFETEKEVVARELDSQDCWRMMTDMHNQLLAGDSDLGRSVGGDEDTVAALSLTDCRSWFEELFVPANMILTVVGDINESEVEEIVSGKLSHVSGAAYVKPKLRYEGGETVYGSRCPEGHLSLGFKVDVTTQKDLYTVSILKNILGSGQSSYLFKRLRDENGLSYNFGCFAQNFENIEYVALWLDCEAKRLPKAAGICADIIRELQQGVSEEMFAIHHMQILGKSAFAMDTPARFGDDLALMARYFGFVQSSAECMEQLRSITRQDVNDMLSAALARAPTMCAMGPMSKLPSLKKMGLDKLAVASEKPQNGAFSDLATGGVCPL